MRIIRSVLSDRRLRRSILRILRENILCSMATVRARNQPHINTANFCYSGLDNLEIFFLSDRTSVHARNLSKNNSMAMTIFRSTQPWDSPGRGLQLFGICSEAEGKAAAKAARIYSKRFPAYAKWMGSTRKDEKLLAKQLRSYGFYRFLPSRAKVLDESVFGGAVLVATSLRPRK